MERVHVVPKSQVAAGQSRMPGYMVRSPDHEVLTQDLKVLISFKAELTLANSTTTRTTSQPKGKQKGLMLGTVVGRVTDMVSRKEEVGKRAAVH